jgi:hypothetical protein
MVPGMGPVNGRYFAVSVKGEDSIIEYNDIDEVGYNGIAFYGNNSEVRFNRVQHFCYLLGDGAGVYSWTQNPDTQVGMKMLNNIVFSGYDCNGLYSDGLTNNLEVANNTVAHMAEHGIHMNQPVDNWLHHNTFFDNGTASNGGAGVDISNLRLGGVIAAGNLVENNLIVAGAGQHLIRLRDNQDDIFSFGNSDRNTHVVPFSTVVPVRTAHNDGSWVNGYHQLDDWRDLFGQDRASTWVPVLPPTFTVDTLVGSNLVTNPEFIEDVAGWTASTDGGSVTSEWDDTGMLDGGALKITHDAQGDPSYIRLYPSGFPFQVDTSRKYVLRFSIVGTKDERSLSIYLRQKSSPWATLAPRQAAHFGTARQEQLLVFDPTSTDADCTIVMEWDENDGTVYLDNFEFYEAQITALDLDLAMHFRLEYNASREPTTISLASPMVDLFGNHYASSVTLQPYTSVILMEP